MRYFDGLCNGGTLEIGDGQVLAFVVSNGSGRLLAHRTGSQVSIGADLDSAKLTALPAVSVRDYEFTSDLESAFVDIEKIAHSLGLNPLHERESDREFFVHETRGFGNLWFSA